MIIGNKNLKAIYVFTCGEKIHFIHLFCIIARLFRQCFRGKVGFENV